MVFHALQIILVLIADWAFADDVLQSINCNDDYTDCWECLQRRWSRTKLSYCCTHAHRGCGPVVTVATTTASAYDCNADYTECWECLQHRWSQKKLNFCCTTAHKGCGPVKKITIAETNNAVNTPHPETGKIVGGVLGGVAGATALGLLGGMFAHHLNETKTMREKLRQVSHVSEHAVTTATTTNAAAHTVAVTAQTTVEPAATSSAAALTAEHGSSGSIGSSGDPLLALIPLLLLLAGLCGALFWFLKRTKTKKISKRRMVDNDDVSEVSDAADAALLASESTSGSASQFVSYDTGQSQYVHNQDFSPTSRGYEGASSTASIASSSPLLGAVTSPRLVASLSAPRLVGWASPGQPLNPAGSFVMEGASASMPICGSVNGASVNIAPTLVPAGMLQVGEHPPMQLIQAGGAITPPAPLMPMGMMFR